MGIAERKERQRAELRETILSAARRIAAEDGLAAMTMRRIADAVEYAPATMYLYFANREEIALALVGDGFTALSDALQPVAAAASDPLERIRAIGRAYVAFGLREPHTYRLIFLEDPKFTLAAFSSDTSTDAQSAGDRAFGVLTSAVTQAVAGGALAANDPGLVAHGLWAALHGVVSLALVCPGALGDVDAVADFVVDTLLAGLRA